MGELVSFFRGFYRVRLRGAAPEFALNRLAEARVAFWGIERIDDFTCDIRVRRRDLDRVQELAERAQAEAELLGEEGFLYRFRGLRHRAAFLVAVAICLGLAYLLPNFIWFLRVEGNERVPSALILRELDELGVGFGTWGDAIRPQDLKNEMLVRIPELEWLTVNHSGALATVVVREREPGGEIVDRRQVTNLVASRDCIVDELQVYSGQAVCEVGQSVRAGELLVSGYADLEFCVEATRALGEVYGRTWRRQDAVLPLEWQRKGAQGDTHTRWALVVGKKRINFFRNSGNWGAGRDRINVYHPLTLPGGWTLPVTLVEERAVERELTPMELDPLEAQSILREGSAEAVRADMVAGEIVREDLDVRREGGVYRLTGTYECREMVARTAPAILVQESEGSP